MGKMVKEKVIKIVYGQYMKKRERRRKRYREFKRESDHKV